MKQSWVCFICFEVSSCMSVNLFPLILRSTHLFLYCSLYFLNLSWFFYSFYDVSHTVLHNVIWTFPTFSHFPSFPHSALCSSHCCLYFYFFHSFPSFHGIPHTGHTVTSCSLPRSLLIYSFSDTFCTAFISVFLFFSLLFSRYPLFMTLCTPHFIDFYSSHS